MFIIVEKNYISLTNREVYKTENRYEACSMVEQLAQEFVKSKEGEANKKLFEYTKTGNWKTHPMGFFMVRDSRFNRIIIMEKKYNPGYLYGNYLTTKTLSYEVVDLKEKVKFEDSKFYNDIKTLLIQDNPQRLDELLDEIEEYENEEEEEEEPSEEKKNEENIQNN